MLFNENSFKNITEGSTTLVTVAREYFNDNMESILEDYDYDYTRGYLAVREELNKQVQEYVFFKQAKDKCLKDFEVIKESVKLTEGFKDLQSVYKSIQHFKGREVYIGLLNMLNDDIIDYAENIIPFYGSTLENCMMYHGRFDSYYYTYFIENSDSDDEYKDEDVLCYTIDLVRELLED